MAAQVPLHFRLMDVEGWPSASVGRVNPFVGRVNPFVGGWVPSPTWRPTALPSHSHRSAWVPGSPLAHHPPCHRYCPGHGSPPGQSDGRGALPTPLSPRAMAISRVTPPCPLLSRNTKAGYAQTRQSTRAPAVASSGVLSYNGVNDASFGLEKPVQPSAIPLPCSVSKLTAARPLPTPLLSCTDTLQVPLARDDSLVI